MTAESATVVDRFAGLPAAATATLRPLLGEGVTVSAPVPVDAVGPADLEGAFVARSTIGGGPAPGSLVTILGGPLPEGVEPQMVVDALAAAVASALGAASGTRFQAGPSDPLPAVSDVAGLGTYIVRSEVGAGSSEPVPVVWVVEASLAALLGGAEPVTAPNGEGPSVAPATLPDLGPGAGPGPRRDLHLLADVPMNVTVELGRAVMRVRDLLALKEGSIVELDRPAGTDVDVLVNGILVARGEVVVIDDELGVRITEVIERS